MCVQITTNATIIYPYITRLAVYVEPIRFLDYRKRMIVLLRSLGLWLDGVVLQARGIEGQTPSSILFSTTTRLYAPTARDSKIVPQSKHVDTTRMASATNYRVTRYASLIKLACIIFASGVHTVLDERWRKKQTFAIQVTI